MDGFLDKRKALLESIVSDLIYKKNLTINICGASGTGKSFLIKECILSITEKCPNIAIIQLYGDAGKQSIPFYPIDAYLSKKNRWKKNIGVIFESSPYLGPMLGHFFNEIDFRHIREREDVIKNNEVLSKNVQFSKELLMLLKKKKHIIIACDDFQYADRDTVDFLQGIIPIFKEWNKTISILATYRTAKRIKTYPCVFSRHKVRTIDLQYPSIDDVRYILHAWGTEINYSDYQVEAIYAATGGHLLLLQHACHFLNQDVAMRNFSTNIDDDYYADLIERRLQESEAKDKITHLMECLAAIGREASIYELKCVLENETVTPIVEEAISFNLLTKDDSVVSFLNDSIREIYSRKKSSNQHDFYSRYAKCLKTLLPSEYIRRALSEKLAGHERQSQILNGLYVINQIREGYSVEVDRFLQDNNVKHAVESIVETYRLSFKGENEQAIKYINKVITGITIPLLYIEAKYTVCVLQFKSTKNEDRLDALHSLISLMDYCEQEEFEIWGRLMRLCISLHCSLNNLDEARNLYKKYRIFLIHRLEYDNKSKYAYFELLLLSDSLYDPNTSHVVLLEMLHELDGLILKGDVKFIPLLYKALVNISSNCIEIGLFEEAAQYAHRALFIAEESDFMQFPNIGAAFNNYLLAETFQKTFSYKRLVSEMYSVMETHLYEEDAVLIKLNYIGALLGNNQINDAINFLGEIEFAVDIQYDSYYYYYFCINKSIALYLSGEHTHSLKNLDAAKCLVSRVSLTRAPYYQEHYKVVHDIMTGKSAYKSLQDLQAAFSVMRPSFLSPNWNYFKKVYLFSDLQIWSDF